MVMRRNLKKRYAQSRSHTKAVKLFNMHWVHDTLDSVITELDERAEDEPEIRAATELIYAVQDLIDIYARRVENSEHK